MAQVTYYDYSTLNQLTTERVLGGDATYYTWTADGAMATKQEVAGWTHYTWDVDESLTKIETRSAARETLREIGRMTMLHGPSATHRELLPVLMRASDMLNNKDLAKKRTRQVKALVAEALALLDGADDLPAEVRERMREALTELHANYNADRGLSVLLSLQCDLNNLLMPQGIGGVRP